MKKIVFGVIVFTFLFLISCPTEEKHTTILTGSILSSIVSIENVKSFSLYYRPTSYSPAWTVYISLNFKSCGEVDMKENGKSLDEAMLKLKKRIECIGE